MAEGALKTGVKGVTKDIPSVMETRFMKSAHKYVTATSGSGRVRAKCVNMNGPGVERTPKNALPSRLCYDLDLPADCSLNFSDKEEREADMLFWPGDARKLGLRDEPYNVREIYEPKYSNFLKGSLSTP